MEIVICALLAYLLSGFAQVIKDLSVRAMDRPMWAMNPTLGKAIMVTLTWPSRPMILLTRSSLVEIAQWVAFRLLGFLIQMTVLTAFIWGAYAIAGLVFESFFLKFALATVIAFFGLFFVLPLISLIMVPVTLLLALLLTFLFPKSSKAHAIDIRWCQTCKHHRKVPEYEDTMKGLWQEKSMPRSDKLPCKIALETSNVWKAYYETDPKSRSLFPKDCQLFERQA